MLTIVTVQLFVQCLWFCQIKTSVIPDALEHWLETGKYVLTEQGGRNRSKKFIASGMCA